jgi:hypothetical protein
MTTSTRSRNHGSENTQRQVAGLGEDEADAQGALEEFLGYQEDRNHSPKTVHWYGDLLGRFLKVLPQEATLAIRRYQRKGRRG